MDSSKYAFQAGLFILFSIAAGIFLIARVAERGGPKDASAYTAVFTAGKDIAGLAVGNEVRLMGVKVGLVESIEIVAPDSPDEDAEVHVGFVVGNGLELREVGNKVELQTALTGGAWLNILNVGTGEKLAEGSEVTGNSTDLFAMVGEVQREMTVTLASIREDLDVVSTELVETADSIETAATDANSLINKIEKEVDPVLKDIDTFLAESTGVMTDVRAVFGDSGDDIRTTLAKLATLSTSLDEKIPGTVDQIAAFVTKAETSIDGVDTLVTELTGTATEARTLLADNRPDIDRTIESARRSVDELEGLVDDLRANPSRLLWPPDEKDLNNLDLYATARTYAKAAEDLESAAAALSNAAGDGETDPIKLQALRQQLLQQFEYFDKLQGEVWERFEK
jgi:phospholipid/cholesterol/gamma-HCH transport system substrate-binding protein